MIKPMKYKGKHKKHRYFEGWYYKSVTADLGYTVSLIPGISKNKIDPHAFIQVIVNNHDKIITEYVRYDVGSFHYDEKTNETVIEDNRFGLEKIVLNITSDAIRVQGQINLANHIPIQTSLFAPSIMGVFSFLPLMECNHDVVSMNHDLDGTIQINDLKINFDHGKGYIEKDYGRSFPDAYVWIQSNHFKDEKMSLMFSYATIPYIGFKFKGFIVNLTVDQKEYRFASYNFSKIKQIEKNEKEIIFEIRKGKYRLLIHALDKETVELPAPKEGVMNQHIKEGLSGTVHIVLTKDGVPLIDDVGKNAGIEMML